MTTSCKHTPQTSKVLNYLETFGTIDAIKAEINLDIHRLAAVIYSLRKEYYITSTWIPATNAFGKNTYYTEYSI